MTASIASLGLPDLASAQSGPTPQSTKQAIIFKNVRVFRRQASTLRDGVSVVVQGNTIVDVIDGDLGAPAGAKIIECGSRTLMPGLIDARTHIMMTSLPIQTTHLRRQ